jgi:hypothetical protein
LEAPQTSLHIGWASDGFPILYRFGPNENNELEELNSSYTLKTGLRPGNGIDAPCGAYSGRYIRDYEFICGKGDLDECNGIQRQLILETKIGLDTFDYFYVITTTYPQVSRCLSGTPSPDFENSVSEYNGPDADNDGYPDIVDCEPNNSAINPGATEIPDNGIDENCDGLDQANVDADGDGFTKENDCDDTNNEIYPGATEICNGLDDNCDGNIDEGFTVIAYFVDADGDGFGDDNAMTEGCMQPPGTSEVGGDCDDQNASINPNGIEIPNNGTDEDCDGEDLTTSIYTLEGNEINVFPNPVSNYLTIEYFGDIEMSFEIYNASANRIMVTPNRIIDLSTISSGVYFLKVKSLKSGKSITHKFIKIQ